MKAASSHVNSITLRPIYTTKIWRALMKKFGLFRGLPLQRNGKINFMPLTQRFDKSVVILNKLFMKELEVSLP